MRFARRNKLPLLLRQETAAAQQLLQLLQKLYHDESCAGMSRVAVDRKKLVVTKLMRYVLLTVIGWAGETIWLLTTVTTVCVKW